MNSRCLLLLQLFASTTAFVSGAEELRMTKIEFAFEDTPIGSAEARPKTIFVAGDHFARIEQFADASSELKNLIVVNEPDIWLVDAARKTAGHAINHGPDLVVHNPVLGPDGPEDLLPLEYGREKKFFDEVKNSRTTSGRYHGSPCQVREVTSGRYRVRLYVDFKTGTPLGMEGFRDEEPFFKLHYLHYQTDLTFDLSLFRPPMNFAVLEADQIRDD